MTIVPGPDWVLLVQGTVADLYLVTRNGGDPIVAKVLRELTPETKRWFAREYRVLNARVHPGIVSILGGDMDSERPYYFMPYFSGGTLTQLAGVLEHSVLRAVAVWLAEAIAALHSREIQHGDIKPDNVLVTSQGSVRMSDPLGNGSGCTVSWGTKTGGTPGYWAPEIAMGQPISKAGDVFALGATLFHLATGISPEDGKSLNPVEYGVSLPSDLQRAVVAMCQHDPARRPSMRDIAKFLSGDAAPPTPPPRPSTSPQVPGWVKLLALGAGAALINRSTKRWDSTTGRYRGSDGKFRGGGLFD